MDRVAQCGPIEVSDASGANLPCGVLSSEPVTQVIQLVELLRQRGLTAVARLDAIGECWRMTIERIEDLDEVRRAHLVRYKPNSSGEAGWYYPGSLPYTVDEYASAVPTISPREYAKIRSLASSIENGLSQDVVLMAAKDTSLDRRVIVDGVHRSTALILLSRANSAGLAHLLASNYKVSIVEFRSRWAHVLYPCDFLEFCNQTRRSP